VLQCVLQVELCEDSGVACELGGARKCECVRETVRE